MSNGTIISCRSTSWLCTDAGENLQHDRCTAADSCHCWIKLTLRSAKQVCWAARSERSGFSWGGRWRFSPTCGWRRRSKPWRSSTPGWSPAQGRALCRQLPDLGAVVTHPCCPVPDQTAWMCWSPPPSSSQPSPKSYCMGLVQLSP